MTEQPTGERRIGVYVCHCGGNISDYVDVDEVVAAVSDNPDVVVTRSTMFACSDAGQQQIVADIEEQGLDGLVVASCSPKLHVHTFRGAAKRAGLNPFEYTQVNVREQCSWAHTDDGPGATGKAICLLKAGIARTRLTTPLEPIEVKTTPRTLVIGGGIAGMRAAVGLADIGLEVFLVEREQKLGGWVGGFGDMYPNGKDGHVLVATLLAEIAKRPRVTVITGAEVVSRSGSFGNYTAGIRIDGKSPETIEVQVGSIVVATGFDTYQPDEGEFGYGIDGVVTLPQFKELVDGSSGSLRYRGRPVGNVVYIYCVGSRQPADEPDSNQYCSRYCCAATAHASIKVADLDAKVHQYHLARDVRTYGKFETLYTDARKRGAVYVKYPDDAPPAVAKDPSGRLVVTVKDLLTGGEESRSRRTWSFWSRGWCRGRTRGSRAC